MLMRLYTLALSSEVLLSNPISIREMVYFSDPRLEYPQ